MLGGDLVSRPISPAHESKPIEGAFARCVLDSYRALRVPDMMSTLGFDIKNYDFDLGQAPPSQLLGPSAGVSTQCTQGATGMRAS